jgi:aryl-alcohol dehydrogenase-like predicted oxidoreductase
MLRLRRFGSRGLMTPPLILGGNVFGWTADAATSFSILDAFVAAGGRMIDTADVYSAWVPGNKGGESETIIGEWLARRGRSEDVLIATKVGAQGGLSAANIESRVYGCSKRLGVDHIDLLYAHRDDQETPLEETLEAFERLVQAGTVRTLGASNYSASRLLFSRRHAVPSPSIGLSHRYSLTPRPPALPTGQWCLVATVGRLVHWDYCQCARGDTLDRSRMSRT